MHLLALFALAITAVVAAPAATADADHGGL